MLGIRARPFRRRAWLALGLVAIATFSAGLDDARPAPAPAAGAGDPTAWREGEPRSLAVTGGSVRFQVAPPSPGSRTLVVVSSLARSGGPFTVRLTARGTDRVGPPALEPEPKRTRPRLDAPRLAPVAEPVAGFPPAERTFHVLARDGDVASPSNYEPIRGVLEAVGQRVQVYVDPADVGRVKPAVIADLVATFDGRILPVSAATIGQARDVDGDGRFTVLISSWLTRLAGGRYAVDGFVRGADLDPAFAPPFGNRCDMMYLSAAIEPGPYLRTIVAHEYTHAVTYSVKTGPAAPGEHPGVDEEGWLDEALAHLVEDLHGFSRSNLDYRISAFLSDPGRYRLVVDDYYTANLFRSHGNRGSTYLFLRWCADCYGPGLLPALVRSRLRGTANLEAATGAPFSDLYRRWSLALYFSGLDPRRPGAPGFRSVDLRGPVGSRELAGPRTTRVSAEGGTATWSLSGTSSHYVVIDASPRRGVDVQVAGPAEAELQVTAVPLPADLPDLELRARAAREPGGGLLVRAEIGGRGGEAARLSALAWEPLVPPADSQRAGVRPGKLDADGLALAFGAATLPRGGTLRSSGVRLSGVPAGAGPLVLKVVGTDGRGRKAAAWAVIEPDERPGQAAAGKAATLAR